MHARVGLLRLFIHRAILLRVSILSAFCVLFFILSFSFSLSHSLWRLTCFFSLPSLARLSLFSLSFLPLLSLFFISLLSLPSAPSFSLNPLLSQLSLTCPCFVLLSHLRRAVCGCLCLCVLAARVALYETAFNFPLFCSCGSSSSLPQLLASPVKTTPPTPPRFPLPLGHSPSLPHIRHYSAQLLPRL